MKKNLILKSTTLALAFSLSMPYIAYGTDFTVTSSQAVSVVPMPMPIVAEEDLDTSISKSIDYFYNTSHNVLTDFADTYAMLSLTDSLDGYTLADTSTLDISDETTRVSTIARRLLLLNANNNDIEQRNILIQKLKSLQKDNGMFGETINGHMYAMIALRNSQADFDVEGAIKVLNDYYVGTTNYYGASKNPNSFGETDIAGFALVALAPFRDNPMASNLIDGTLAFLHDEQLEDGGFQSDSTQEWSTDTSNSNSTATVISGLIAVGEDIDANWSKNGKTPIDSLLSFQNPDGSFIYSKEWSAPDDYISFNQSVMALGDYANNRCILNSVINTSNIITKSDLLSELDKATSLDKEAYTESTYNELQDNISYAQGVYDNPLATDDEIYLAISMLRTSLNNLEKVPTGTTDNENKITVTQSVKTIDGTSIVPTSSFTIEEGSSVFDLLEYSTDMYGVPMTSRGSGSNVYISKIGDYEEFAHGVNSGFEYYVNGVKKSVSSAITTLHDGDTVSWIYEYDYVTGSTNTPTEEIIEEVLPTEETALTKYTKVTKDSTFDQSQTIKTLEDLSEIFEHKETLSNFEQIFLKQYTVGNDAEIIDSLYAEISETKGDYRKVTDLARICLTLQFYNQDIENINGINLYDKLITREDLNKQGVNGYIYTAFVCKMQNDTENFNNMIDHVIEYQNADGGFSLDINGESELDLTAMALQALSLTEGKEDIISKGLDYLSATISTTEDLTSESISQSIMALAMLNIDINDEHFIFEDKNLVDMLFEYQLEDGTFAHELGSVTDDIATEQASLALYAVYDLYNNTEELIFTSNETMTRLDFVTLLFENLGLEIYDSPLDNNFVDLNDNSMSTKYVNTLYEMGVVNGYIINDERYFNPDADITRQDLATIVMRLNKSEITDSSVAIIDIDEVSDYAKDYVIDFATQYDVLNEGYFYPMNTVKYSEVNILR